MNNNFDLDINCKNWLEQIDIITRFGKENKKLKIRDIIIQNALASIYNIRVNNDADGLIPLENILPQGKELKEIFKSTSKKHLLGEELYAIYLPGEVEKNGFAIYCKDFQNYKKNTKGYKIKLHAAFQNAVLLYCYLHSLDNVKMMKSIDEFYKKLKFPKFSRYGTSWVAVMSVLSFLIGKSADEIISKRQLEYKNFSYLKFASKAKKMVYVDICNLLGISSIGAFENYKQHYEYAKKHTPFRWFRKGRVTKATIISTYLGMDAKSFWESENVVLMMKKMKFNVFDNGNLFQMLCFVLSADENFTAKKEYVSNDTKMPLTEFLNFILLSRQYKLNQDSTQSAAASSVAVSAGAVT